MRIDKEAYQKQSEHGVSIFCSRKTCLLYTSDAADERSSVDLGGRRIIKKKKQLTQAWCRDILTKIKS